MLSNSLCLYSISNPLGRPRGTKNKRSRPQPSSNGGGSDQALVDRDSTVMSSEQDTAKRPLLRRQNAGSDGRMGLECSDPVVTNSQHASSLSGRGLPTPMNNHWPVSTEEERNVSSTSVNLAPNSHRNDFTRPIYSGNQRQPVVDPLLDIHGQSTNVFDVSMLDLAYFDNSGTQCPLAWDDFANNAEESYTETGRVRGTEPSTQTVSTVCYLTPT